MTSTVCIFPRKRVEEKLAAGVPYVIRQNNPTEGTTTFEDEIYGDITVDNAELDDMILIKSDGDKVDLQFCNGKCLDCARPKG